MRSSFLIVPAVMAALTAAGAAPSQPAPSKSALAKPTLAKPVSFARIPLSFEANHGQAGPNVRFLSQGKGYRLQLGEGEARLSVKRPGMDSSAVVTMRLPGSLPGAALRAEDKQPGVSNYFLGRDPRNWRTGVPHYGKVRYQNVYRGIDLVYYGNQRQLEFDFVVAPGADPNAIRMQFEGQRKLRIDRDGNLILNVGPSEMVQKKPVIYQEHDGERRPIEGRYVLASKNEVRFQVGAYDHRNTLVIDPVLTYSTFFGGSSQDDGRDLAIDAQRNVYLTGSTESENLVTRNPAQATKRSGSDAYITKIDPTGTTVLYSTYIGGGGVVSDDRGVAIAVDPQGQIHIAGYTASSEFPVSPNAFQRTFGGSIFPDGFVVKLNAAGSQIIYSSYLGGADVDRVMGIALDNLGNAFVTGYTKSANFPVRNAIQETNRGLEDAFLAKINPLGTELVYSTYIGGTQRDLAYDIAVDGNNQPHIVGETTSPDFPVNGALQAAKKPEADAFVLRMNTAGTAIAYSSYLGGSGRDQAFAIALDGVGNMYLTGTTSSTDFPVSSAYQAQRKGAFDDAFVTKLTSGGSIAYSTYYGGSLVDEGLDIAVDTQGRAYVVGGAWSEDLPLRDPLQAIYGGNFKDAFVAVFGNTGATLEFATYMGGTENDNRDNVIEFLGFGGIAVDSARNIYVVGTTASSNFPITSGTVQPIFGGNSVLGSGDAFVAKIGSGAVEPPGGGGGGGGGGGTGGNQTTISTFPANLRFYVDGLAYTGGQTFSWPAGETHQVSVEAQQGNSQSRYSFANWSDGAPASRTITAGSTPSLYVANFTAQHYVTMIAGPGGAVTPQSGWFTQGAQIGISALPNTGFAFAGWTGTGTGSYSGMANPLLLTVGGPITETAIFNSTTGAQIGAYFVPMSPCRLVDTRSGQGTGGAFGPPTMPAATSRTFPVATSNCNIPTFARAYAVNITVVPQGPLSYLTIWPTGQPRPLVSTLNSFDGRIVANSAIVPAGANGSIDVFVTNLTDVVIDLAGYFTQVDPNAFGLYTTAPCRAVDTRIGQGTTGQFGPPAITGGTSRDFTLPTSRCALPADAKAYAVNATVVPQGPLGYLTLWPAGQARPLASTLNASDGQITANSTIVPAGNAGGISAYVTNTTDLLVDVNGYFGTRSANSLAFYPIAPCRLLDTRPGEGTTGEFGPPSIAGNSTRTIIVPSGRCNIPFSARAFSVNVTVVPQGSLPYLTIWPASQAQPTVSLLNSFAGKILANAAIIPAGPNGSLSIFAAATTDVIIDINGYFAP
ncbi:MAG: SBBP repeat-containing protein [Bryobacterales bacterium]|nr:SBBP repeat-containing protein [Bryobacterales bacterium]